MNIDTTETSHGGFSPIKKGWQALSAFPIKTHIIVGTFFTVIIFFFSMFLIGLAISRSQVSTVNYENTTRVYNGDVIQRAPLLNALRAQSNYFKDTSVSYTPEQLNRFVQNTNITSTDVNVKVVADFVKKGLEYQPTFKTEFAAQYILKNSLDQESVVAFEFPFPFSVATNEISNVKLFVDGKEIANPKAKVSSNADGLKWEGKIPAGEQAVIKVVYNTVGIARVKYEGFENNLGSQDFKLNLTIIGTRSYDLNSGLSIDKRLFSDKKVVLIWDKKNLFSTPLVDVSIAEKLAPSNQVARIYVAMMPLYVLLITILLALGLKNKNVMNVKDMVILSVLYILYFPLLHYLVSFTIDPTMELFANIPNVGYFSLPLYGAFAIALVVIVGLIYYLFGVVYGLKYSSKLVLPALLMCLGFFPFAITIPEYSILLVLFGLIILVFTWIQQRLTK